MTEHMPPGAYIAL